MLGNEWFDVENFDRKLEKLNNDSFEGISIPSQFSTYAESDSVFLQFIQQTVFSTESLPTLFYTALKNNFPDCIEFLIQTGIKNTNKGFFSRRTTYIPSNRDVIYAIENQYYVLIEMFSYIKRFYNFEIYFSLIKNHIPTSMLKDTLFGVRMIEYIGCHASEISAFFATAIEYGNSEFLKMLIYKIHIYNQYFSKNQNTVILIPPAKSLYIHAIEKENTFIISELNKVFAPSTKLEIQEDKDIEEAFKKHKAAIILHKINALPRNIEIEMTTFSKKSPKPN